MVRVERLELSHPKTLEPKSSASTNSATLAKNGLLIYGKTWIHPHVEGCPVKSGVKFATAPVNQQPLPQQISSNNPHNDLH